MNKRNFKAFLAVLLTVVMVFSIVPLSVSAEETTVTFDFSSLTGKGTEITSSNALSTFKGCASDDSYLTAVTTSKIYNGNGSGGLKANTAGFLKTGTSSKNGELTMTFTEKVNKVELVCHAWNTSGNDTVSVNGSAAQKAPTNGDITEKLTFEIDASETVSIVTAKRAFIKSITVYMAGSTGSEGGEEETPSTPTAPETTVVTAPEAGVAYKFGMVQGNLDNKVYYLAGGMNGYYMETTENAASAIDVYLEATEGGYYLYTVENDAKTYINMVVSGTYVNAKYEATASTVYTWNAEKNTVVSEVNGEDYWHGTRNDKTYTTVGPVKVSYNGFYCQFYAVEAAEPEVPDTPDTPALPTTPEEIVNAAYALESGAALEGTYTLTGVITTVNTAYDASYKNVTVTIQVGDMADKPIQCFRMKGEGADTIKTGDTITVTGTLKNYNGIIEFDAGCTLDNVVPGEKEVVIYETAKEIVDAAYALEIGASLSDGHKYTLTGVITSVDTEYSEQYKNVTVTIVVDGMTDKPIVVFRLKGEGADTIKVGDTITVSGSIVNYDNKDGTGTVEFNSGCTLDKVVPATPDPVPTGDAMILLVPVVLLAGAALVVVSRKRRFN